jgi:hypothetical protein
VVATPTCGTTLRAQGLWPSLVPGTDGFRRRCHLCQQPPFSSRRYGTVVVDGAAFVSGTQRKLSACASIASDRISAPAINASLR